MAGHWLKGTYLIPFEEDVFFDDYWWHLQGEAWPFSVIRNQILDLEDGRKNRMLLGTTISWMKFENIPQDKKGDMHGYLYCFYQYLGRTWSQQAGGTPEKEKTESEAWEHTPEPRAQMQGSSGIRTLS